MKATKIEQLFTPISINITFETQEEYDMFRELMSRDVSIPDRIYPTNEDNREQLSEMMSSIHDIL